MQNLTHSLAETRHPNKVCSKCRVEKPLNDFHRKKQGLHGRAAACKQCKAEVNAQYYVDNSAQWVDYSAQNYAANRDLRAEQIAAYRLTPEGRGATWAHLYRSRARRYGFAPVIEQFTSDDVVNLYGDACVHCGGTFEHLDHFPVPVRDGGHHTLKNVVPSCAQCNVGRSNKERANRS